VGGILDDELATGPDRLDLLQPAEATADARGQNNEIV
jgi:hypothetical protein